MGALKLYELPGQWREIQAEIDACEGEISPEMEKDMARIHGTLEQKAEAICRMRAQLKAEAEAAKKEADRLTALARTRTKKAEWLTEYLKNTLVAMDVHRVETSSFRVSLCTNGRPSVTFTGDPATLPEDWQVKTIHADTQKAFETWDANEPVPEGFVITLGKHLRIT